MIRFEVITIFPEMISPYSEASILGRAQKKKLLKITAHDLRRYSNNKHKKVDDTPYGGGAGMVMGVEAFDRAVRAVKRMGQRAGEGMWAKVGRIIGKRSAVLTSRVILTAASGKRFTQADAKRLAKYDQLIFLCGRYEGVDHRVAVGVADEVLSIGDYVLTGGELPALVMIDAIARNVPGVLGNKETLNEESHNEAGVLEYPQYTRPEVFIFMNANEEKVSLTVPEVLLSGDHQKIAKWRADNQTLG